MYLAPVHDDDPAGTHTVRDEKGGWPFVISITQGVNNSVPACNEQDSDFPVVLLDRNAGIAVKSVPPLCARGSRVNEVLARLTNGRAHRPAPNTPP